MKKLSEWWKSLNWHEKDIVGNWIATGYSGAVILPLFSGNLQLALPIICSLFAIPIYCLIKQEKEKLMELKRKYPFATK